MKKLKFTVRIVKKKKREIDRSEFHPKEKIIDRPQFA